MRIGLDTSCKLDNAQYSSMMELVILLTSNVAKAVMACEQPLQGLLTGGLNAV